MVPPTALLGPALQPPFDFMMTLDLMMTLGLMMSHLVGMAMAGKKSWAQAQHPSASSPRAALQQGQGKESSARNVSPPGRTLSLQIMRGDPFVPANMMSPPLNSQPVSKCCKKLGGVAGELLT